MAAIVRLVVKSANAPPPLGAFSQAISVNNTMFVSGQIGADPSGQLVSGGVGAEAKQALKNVGTLLTSAKAGFKHIVKAKIFLTDINDFSVVDAEYKTCFPDGKFPARAAYAVEALPKGARVQIEAWALTMDLPDKE